MNLMIALKRIAILSLLLVATGCGNSTAYWTKQVKSPDSATRLHAISSLKARVREAQVVVPVLVDALKDEDTFIRRDAARALGKFGPAATQAVPSLHSLLDDQEPSVRKAAAQSLKQIDPGAAAEAGIS